MSDKIIDGKKVAEAIHEECQQETKKMLEETGKMPGLAVILVGERKDSQTYVRNKKRMCVKDGIKPFDYTFPETMTVSSCEVYWFDDAPWGETRVPAEWKVLYQDASGNWKEVENPSAYGVERGSANIVNFTPVSTKALRLQIQLEENFAAGISEWAIK